MVSKTPSVTNTASDESTCPHSEPSDFVVGGFDTDSEQGYATKKACPSRKACWKACCNKHTCNVFLCCLFVALVVLFIGAIVEAEGGGGGGRGGSSWFFASSGGTRGGWGGACFPAGEKVLLEDMTSEVPIESLEPGSKVASGGLVTAVMKLSATEDDPIYRYNSSVSVTGTHLVLEGSDWKPVEESDFAVLQAGEAPGYVYNLITSKHKMVVNKTIFADWDPEELEDYEETWALESKILNRLNEGNFDHATPLLKASQPITEGAFAANTPISLSNGKVISIEDVQPGDELAGGNVVFSVMQVYVPEDTATYSYKDLSVTEWTIVFDDDGLWRHVKHSPIAGLEGTVASSSNLIWYQLWTTNHQVPVADGLTFADYHVLDEEDPIFLEEL